MAGSAALGGTASTALVSAGAALGGAALTRAVDLGKEHRAETQQAKAAETQAWEQRLRDLDETRRVAYMALLAGRTRNPEIAATIVNALAHHGLRLYPDAVIKNVANLLTTDSAQDDAERTASEYWIQKVIFQITDQIRQEARGPD